MRIITAAIMLLILTSCANGPQDPPGRSQSSVVRETPSRAEQRAELEDELRRSIHIWRNELLPRAKASKVNDKFKGDRNIVPLYTAAAASINVYIDTYTAELDSGSPSSETLHELAVRTDNSVADFVRYVDVKNNNAAVNWIAIAPIVKDIFSMLYDKYRAWKADNKAAAEAQLKIFKDSLQRLRVEESYDKV